MIYNFTILKLFFTIFIICFEYFFFINDKKNSHFIIFFVIEIILFISFFLKFTLDGKRIEFLKIYLLETLNA